MELRTERSCPVGLDFGAESLSRLDAEIRASCAAVGNRSHQDRRANLRTESPSSSRVHASCGPWLVLHETLPPRVAALPAPLDRVFV